MTAVRAGGYLAGSAAAAASAPGSNALIMLNRIAFFETAPGSSHDGGKRARAALGVRAASSARTTASSPAVARRREAALDAGRPDAQAPALHRGCGAEPEWRLAVGLGNKANAHEIGLALHGTYGWPVIPGSALKGLAAAWAASSGGSTGRIGGCSAAPGMFRARVDSAGGSARDGALPGRHPGGPARRGRSRRAHPARQAVLRQRGHGGRTRRSAGSARPSTTTRCR